VPDAGDGQTQEEWSPRSGINAEWDAGNPDRPGDQEPRPWAYGEYGWLYSGIGISSDAVTNLSEVNIVEVRSKPSICNGDGVFPIVHVQKQAGEPKVIGAIAWLIGNSFRKGFNCVLVIDWIFREMAPLTK
jgi:hypothetical protein